MTAEGHKASQLRGQAADIVEALGLSPHPEGGWYLETYRETPADGGRGTVTQIFYMLAAGEQSAWHRVTDATEIWHHYDGAPLQLSLCEQAGEQRDIILGKNLGQGQKPNTVVPRGCWQAARSLGDWTLVGCTVAPAFEFSGFEMAPEGWQP